MKKENPTYYAIIESEVRYDNRLTDSEKLMYAEITALTQKNGICWASNKYFADLYEVSERTITRRIKNLEDSGHIKIAYTYKKNSKFIESRKIYINSKYDRNVSLQHDKDVLDQYDNSVQPQYDKTVGENTTSKSNTTSINNNNPIVPLENETLFNEFWKAYPRKNNKKRSKQLYKRIDKETHEIIMRDLDQRKRTDDWIKNNGKFIPHPSTYLNNERWNDEIEGIQEDEFRRVPTV